MTSLKAKCIDSLSPSDSEVLWTAFRKRFNSVSSNLQVVCAVDAMENLYQSMSFDQLNVPKRQVHFLKNVLEFDSYASFFGENDEAEIVEDQNAGGQIAEEQVDVDQATEE